MVRRKWNQMFDVPKGSRRKSYPSVYLYKSKKLAIRLASTG